MDRVAASWGENVDRISAASPAEFRAWLDANHDTASAVWLVYYKKSSATPSITWSEAVDEALCYGWIDSRSQSLDDERYEQYFTARRPGSPWSKVNKDKIDRLQQSGRLTAAGHAAIDAAKADGSWTILDEAERHIVPADLAEAFPNPHARAHFDSMPPSRRRNILQWIALAKRRETRAKRIAETARACAEGETPNGL